ncbi:hypothetical protein FRC00_008956, partial [Tulasnella sp. 408]
MSFKDTPSRSSLHTHCPVQQVPVKENPTAQGNVQTAATISLALFENQDGPAAAKRGPGTVVKVPDGR